MHDLAMALFAGGVGRISFSSFMFAHSSLWLSMLFGMQLWLASQVFRLFVYLALPTMNRATYFARRAWKYACEFCIKFEEVVFQDGGSMSGLQWPCLIFGLCVTCS